MKVGIVILQSIFKKKKMIKYFRHLNLTHIQLLELSL